LDELGETILPPLEVPVPDMDWNNKNVDPILGVFQQIAKIAASPIPGSSLPPAKPQSSESEGDASTEKSDMDSADGSSWESDQSSEEGMDMDAMMLDVDTGGTTFATS